MRYVAGLPALTKRGFKMAAVTFYEVVGDVVHVKPARREYVYSFEGVLPVEGRDWESREIAAYKAHGTKPDEFKLDCALAHWVGKAVAEKDVRYYLCNLGFHPQTGCMVASDGHRVHLYEPEGASVANVNPVEWVYMSKEMLGKLPKKGVISVKYSKENVNGDSLGLWVVSFTVEGVTYRDRSDVAKFPDVSRVIPQGWCDNKLDVDKKLLSAAAKALKLYKQSELGTLLVTKDGNRVSDKVYGFAGQDRGLPVIDLGFRSDYVYPNFAPNGAPAFSPSYLLDALAMCEFGKVSYKADVQGAWAQIKIDVLTAGGRCTAVVMGQRGMMKFEESVAAESSEVIERFKAQVAAHKAR